MQASWYSLECAETNFGFDRMPGVVPNTALPEKGLYVSHSAAVRDSMGLLHIDLIERSQ